MHLPKPSQDHDFENVPPGTFLALCYRFVDLGTQVVEWSGQKKTQHKVMLSWEIVDEFMSDGRPFTISSRYTWSMSDKATLRKHLEAWRGKAFTDDDFDGPNAFDTRKLIGAPCTLSISQTSKGDKTYSNVSGIGPKMKGLTAPPMINPPVYLALTPEGWDASVYGGLSDSLKATIAGSPEYKEIMQASHRHDDMSTGLNPGFDPEDSVPF